MSAPQRTEPQCRGDRCIPRGRGLLTGPAPETLAALDLAACGLMQTSDDGTFRRANARFCSWLGFSEADLVGKRRLQDLLTVGARIFHQTHWAPLLRMQGSLSEVKLELVHRDGSTIPAVLNAIRHDEDGEYVHEIAAFVARDRDRYERELLLSRKRAEGLLAEISQLHADERDRAVFAEQMIGIVSHDLRNPLSAISIAAELLESAPASADHVIPRISRAVERANRLISDLLDFTQARVGKGLAVSIVKADLHTAIAEIVDELRGTYPQRRLVHVARGPSACAFDANRLAQLVGNLVSNAVAYGEPDAPITIESIVTDASCSVSVHNLGPPIPPAIANTLFEPMTRGTSDHSKRRSVGLGLFIVREIAKAHGGSASVESSAERGTTFTVVFPSRP